MNRLKITVLAVLMMFVTGNFLSSQEVVKKTLQVPDVTLIAIMITKPTSADRWSIGIKYEIHYKLINIKTFHWVKLLKGGKYLGNFAGGNDIGTFEIKLAVTCGGPLLNGVKYGPGSDYQIEVATSDNKISTKSEMFSIVALQIPPTQIPQNISAKTDIKLLPDLAISQVNFFPNDVFKAQVTVANKGPGDSTPCILLLQVGCGNINSFKKVMVDIPALKGSKPGAWPDINSQKTVEIKSPVAFSSAYAIFTIDPNNSLKEVNDNNNTWKQDRCVK